MSDSLLDTLGDLLRPPVPYPDPVPFLLAELAKSETLVRCGNPSCFYVAYPHDHPKGGA